MGFVARKMASICWNIWKLSIIFQWALSDENWLKYVETSEKLSIFVNGFCSQKNGQNLLKHLKNCQFFNWFCRHKNGQNLLKHMKNCHFLTRSLASYFPKIIDFHSKFSKLWNALTPSILIAQESYRPFWNRQIQFFQKQLYFDILSQTEKCPELQTWENPKTSLTTSILVAGWHWTC